VICRREKDGWLLISQPAHAWLAGELAALWGNEEFEPPTPQNAVIMATRLHDIGWAERDAQPRLNDQGCPVNFLETTLEETHPIWERAIEKVGLMDPYAGLLVGMHARTIYRRRLERSADPPDSQEEVIARIENLEQRQTTVRAELHDHPNYSEKVAVAELEANYRILRACDLFSLAVCTGNFPSGVTEQVPNRTDGEYIPLGYSLSNEGGLQISPYPLTDSPIRLSLSARKVVPSTFGDAEEFWAALQTAEWVSLEFEFKPG